MTSQVDEIVTDPDTAAAPVGGARVKVAAPGGSVARAVLPHLDAGARVIMPTGPAFDEARAGLAGQGVECRSVRYWVEEENIPGSRFVQPQLSPVGSARSGAVEQVTNPVLVTAARDAFDTVWDSLEPDTGQAPAEPVPVGDLVPGPWARFLPFPTFNPAQAEAVPHLVPGGDAAGGHVVVVAPTGAGKTVVGMVACLSGLFTPSGERTGKKAVWLVPQRSLTSELHDTLGPWRGMGLRVEALSGEAITDLRATREADVMVATTEKFESLSRSAGMREALEQVAVMVVDEIHLLGDQSRGPVLEALLARVRHTNTQDRQGTGPDAAGSARVVGLSATVTNADEVADWLGATLVRVAWRPTRLTWQVPCLPPSQDRMKDEAVRTAAVVDLAGRVREDGGSVLVFCGTKKKVRQQALELARQRGAQVAGVDSADPDQVEAVCTPAGIGLHYSDWPHKRAAEAGFRGRRLDTLVATSSVAAGVNLPARAVIVRDTSVGLGEPIDVASVQQMFGRAGRVGHGETEGWAFLLATADERPGWLAKLAAGNTVRSRIAGAVEDHLLAEIIQGRVTTKGQAEAWWVGTFAYHQETAGGRAAGHDVRAGTRVERALAQLVLEGMVVVEAGDDPRVDATGLGVLTSRMMIPFRDAVRIRAELGRTPYPTGAQDAEWALVKVVAEQVDAFKSLPVPERSRDQVGRIVGAGGDVTRLARKTNGEKRRAMVSGSHLVQAALLLVTRSPQVFTGRARVVAGVPFGVFFPVLAEAPRYLSWLAGQGALGTVHPWVAVTAADVGRRTRWWSLGAPRGAGRLLWMLEQMTGSRAANEAVPPMWGAAQDRGVRSPDWGGTTPPRGCTLRQDWYEKLLDERVGNIVSAGSLTVPDSGAVGVWEGFSGEVEWHRDPGQVVELAPAASGAVFSNRGDYGVTDGWLLAYRATPAGPQPSQGGNLS